MSKSSFIHKHLIKYCILKEKNKKKKQKQNKTKQRENWFSWQCAVISKRTVVGLFIDGVMSVFQQPIPTFTDSFIVLHKMVLLKTCMYSNANNTILHYFEFAAGDG